MVDDTVQQQAQATKTISAMHLVLCKTEGEWE